MFQSQGFWRRVCSILLRRNLWISARAFANLRGYAFSNDQMYTRRLCRSRQHAAQRPQGSWSSEELHMIFMMGMTFLSHASHDIRLHDLLARACSSDDPSGTRRMGIYSGICYRSNYKYTKIGRARHTWQLARRFPA